MSMKRIALSAVLLVLISCILTSCIYIPIHKNYDFTQDEVASVSIYDTKDHRDGDTTEYLLTAEPVYTAADDDIDVFLSDLGKIRFSDSIIIFSLGAVDPSFYYDRFVVRIDYSSGNFEFISSLGYGEVFDSDGERVSSHHYGCNVDEWDEFINKYIPKDLYDDSDEII